MKVCILIQNITDFGQCVDFTFDLRLILTCILLFNLNVFLFGPNPHCIIWKYI